VILFIHLHSHFGDLPQFPLVTFSWLPVRSPGGAFWSPALHSCRWECMHSWATFCCSGRLSSLFSCTCSVPSWKYNSSLHS
jgi:hypothetical protein